MAAVVPGDDLPGAAELLFEIFPKKRGADQTVATDDRQSPPDRAVEDLGPVETFDESLAGAGEGMELGAPLP